MNRFLPFALAVAFFLVAYNVFLSSKPQDKAPIYKEIKRYSPYYFEKRFGGLEIRSKVDKNLKEKPSNMEVFHRLEALEKEWGKSSLKLENDTILVYSHDKVIAKIKLHTKEDLDFVKSYFGI